MLNRLEEGEIEKRVSLASNSLKSNGGKKADYQIIRIQGRTHTVWVVREERQIQPGVRKGRDS